jgi:hypothetical protein
MMLMRLATLVILFSWVAHGYIQAQETFSESLSIQKLTESQTLFHFEFHTTRFMNASSNPFYRVFPKSLGHLLNAIPVASFQVYLTQGRYRYDTWALPDMSSAKPQGAEVSAMFDESMLPISTRYAH